MEMLGELTVINHNKFVSCNQETQPAVIGGLHKNLKRLQSVPASFILRDIGRQENNLLSKDNRLEERQDEQVLARKTSLPVLFAKLRNLTKHRISHIDNNVLAIELTQF
eukprot:TRINITY_DN2331_c0_g2_i1.p4 TRINITY_DN2331_c0_g2~~TRINITY_DN2331_c0_g2_i1.p4  ORF type:complete len:109 (-),score=4.92 TRINITY_DN2331_c0_g2_i1:1242-1568(-)